MKTLIIAPYSPYPAVFGGAIRLYHVVKMFASFSEVTLLAYNTVPNPRDSEYHLQTICEKARLIDNAPLETQPKWQLQMRGLLGTKSFQYYSFYTDHFQEAIDAELRRYRFDYIVTEQSQMAFFKAYQPGAVHILDQQNIEYELLARRAAVQSQLPKRLALHLEAYKYKRQELALCAGYDLIFTPSERERDELRQLLRTIRVECLPNSIDPDYFALHSTEPEPATLAFVGTTHVDANRDGLIYFMEEIFPLIERQMPAVQFLIVGGKPPAEIREFGKRPNVEVTGFVDDVRPYMARSRALVVPLRSGGGTRLKILEGLSFGVPTVSTTIGAEGLDLQQGVHILLADTPQAFASQVVQAMENEALRTRLIAAGRSLVEARYSWQAVGRTLEQMLHEVAVRKAAPAIPAVKVHASKLS